MATSIRMKIEAEAAVSRMERFQIMQQTMARIGSVDRQHNKAIHDLLGL